MRRAAIPIALAATLALSSGYVAAASPVQSPHRETARSATLGIAEARSAARMIAREIAPVFIDGTRVRTANDCRRVARQTVVCRSVVRAPDLHLRYLTYVQLTSDRATVEVYWRNLEILRQPKGPF